MARLITPYPPASQLTVSDEPYQVRCPRGRGEKTLIQLARTHPEEGAWVFSRGTWFNVRIGSHNEHGHLGARMKLLPLHEYGPAVTHYHTHPLLIEHASRASYVEQLVQELPPETPVSLPLIASYLAASYTALPTIVDLNAYLHLAATSLVPVDFRIASPHGLMRVKLSERLTPAALDEAIRAAERSLLTRPPSHRRCTLHDDLGDYVNRAVDENAAKLIRRTITIINQELEGALQLQFTPRRT